MLIRDTRGCYRHEIEQAVGKNATCGEVLDYIFGNYQNDYNSDCEIVIRVWDGYGKKITVTQAEYVLGYSHNPDRVAYSVCALRKNRMGYKNQVWEMDLEGYRPFERVI